MKQLPVFSAAPEIPEFDRREDLRAAVVGAGPTLGRLSTSATQVRGAAAKRPSGTRQDPAAGFSMSGFG